MSDRSFIPGANEAWENVDTGVRRQILGHGEDLMMVRVDFENGAIGSMHNHPHRQVTYVVNGRFRVTIDGEKRELSPGDCFYVKAYLMHGVEALEAGTLIDVFTPSRQDFLAKR